MIGGIAYDLGGVPYSQCFRVVSYLSQLALLFLEISMIFDLTLEFSILSKTSCFRRIHYSCGTSLRAVTVVIRFIIITLDFHYKILTHCNKVAC